MPSSQCQHYQTPIIKHFWQHQPFIIFLRLYANKRLMFHRLKLCCSSTSGTKLLSLVEVMHYPQPTKKIKEKNSLTLIKMFCFTPSILHFINYRSCKRKTPIPPWYTISGLQKSVFHYDCSSNSCTARKYSYPNGDFQPNN